MSISKSMCRFVQPAKALGAEGKIGSITEDKYADFIITNGDFSEKSVRIAAKKSELIIFQL